MQLGVDPALGVLVSGLDLATTSWLVGLDGSRSEAEILAEAAAAGIDVADAVRILSGLASAGVLLAGPVEGLCEAGPLLPELIDLTADSPVLGEGNQTLANRARRHVVIDGANRVGVPLAALLAASGVGTVSFLDDERVRRCDVSVGGFSPDDEGDLRTLAAARALRRISPRAATPASSDPTGAQAADLVILCRPWIAHDPVRIHRLPERGVHLSVAVREGTVVIGPLVVPGRTSCLRCAELHRSDRDPRWPAVAAQLGGRLPRAVQEPTSVLATLAAALAASQALDHLDGIRLPVVIEATLELRPPDWQLHRRRWPAHTDCGCLAGVGDPARAG